MNNFEEIKFPSTPNVPTHFFIKNAAYLPFTGNIPKGLNKYLFANKPFFDINEKFIVIEDGLGIEAKITKILYNNLYYLVEKDNIVPLDGVKPLYSPSNKETLQPDEKQTSINWKDQNSNIVYEDKQTGKFCVHYETEYEKVDGKEDLKQKIKEACYKGTTLILKENGRKYDDEYVSLLIENYYLFSQAEEYFFPLRPCSTLRVLVTVPSRYLFSDGISINQSIDTFPIIDKNRIKQIDNVPLNIFPIGGTKNLNIAQQTNAVEQNNKYLQIVYNNYSEFADHFNKISSLLEKYLVVYSSKQWNIEPVGVFLYLFNEIQGIKNYYETINSFLLQNRVYIPGTKWNGKLILTFDEDNRMLSKLEFYNSNNILVPLNIGVDKFLQDNIITNKTSVNYIIKIQKGGNIGLAFFGNLLGDITKADEEFKNFITSNHYPLITNITPEPIDLVNCVVNNNKKIRDIINYKLPQTYEQMLVLRTQQQENQLKEEGDFFVKSLIDINSIQDRNFRLLFGLDKVPQDKQESVFQTINRVLAAANLFDIQRFLVEALKCRAIDFDPSAFNKLLKDYQKTRDALEKIALSTMCNPYFSQGLNLIQNFSLPLMPVYNRNKTLINEIQKLIFKLANDLIVLTIRKSLTDSFKACLKDKNPKFGSNDISEIQNSIDADDPAVDDILRDVYGPKALNGPNGRINIDNKKAAKNVLNGVLDDFSRCLSTKELCDLLSGKTVNDEVYDTLKSLIKRKYSKDENLLNKFNNKDYINSFFTKIGALVDVKTCQDIIELETYIPKSPLCDDGTFLNLRKKLLLDKGLTPELVDSLLKDTKEKEQKNLEDVLDFIESGLNIDKIPDLMCQNGYNPLQMISPSVESFKNLLESLFTDVYDSFDKEAENWYKSTYSISSSTTNNFLILESGSLIPNTASLLQKQSDDAISGSQTLLPEYIFSDLLKNNNYNFSYDKDIIINSNIDGYKQQLLDISAIEDKLRQDTQIAEESAKQFLSAFEDSYKLFLSISTGKSILSIAQSAANGSLNLDTFLNTDLVTFIKFSDAFLRSNVIDLTNNTDRLALITGINEDNESNYLLLASEGASVYVALMEFLSKPNTISSLKQLISMMSARVNTPINNGSLLQEQPQGFNQYLNNLYDTALSDYEKVKYNFNIVFKTKNSYPKYDLTLNLGNQNYNLLINKNNNKYINITQSFVQPSEDTINYINKKLNIDVFDRKECFNKFISISNSKFNDKKIFNEEYNKNYNAISDYDFVANNILESIKNNIKSNKNLFFKLKEIQSNSNTSNNSIGNLKFPYTRFIKLVLPQTSKQKACNIRSNYLDIDKTKKDILENKNICIEEIADERIQNGLPVNTNDLQNVAINQTQNSILKGVYDLAIRTYLHDMLLRGISVFGYYDPQILRNDPIFIDYLASAIESEIRSIDQTFFKLMINYLSKSENKSGKEAFKAAISRELKENVLVKLAKRLDEDTNKEISKLKNETNKIKLKNLTNDLKNLNIIKIINNSVYLRILDNGSYSYIKIYESLEDTENSFASSEEYNFLFNYIFPFSSYLTFFYINSVLCRSTKKQNLDSFKGTKKIIRDLAKMSHAGGQSTIPNPNNLQDVINSDNDFNFERFIFDALISTPISIFKGFMEASEPNIQLSTTIYRFGKQMNPELTSWIRPSISIPLGTIPTPITSVLPFTNPVLSLIYFATGLWYEDAAISPADKNNNLIKDLAANPNSDLSCEESDLSSGEKISINNGIYEIINK